MRTCRAALRLLIRSLTHSDLCMTGQDSAHCLCCGRRESDVRPPGPMARRVRLHVRLHVHLPRAARTSEACEARPKQNCEAV